MKSNYKLLGDYIERCDEFNTGLSIGLLEGISNNKYFQKAKTNTNGVDLQKYRIVRTGQFAFNRATTRNGDKISIALREGKDCIVSPSYRVFRSKDENILNSQYLMMWFRRPEFDRYARFKSHGSAHEFFDWEEMRSTKLPIPPIDVQIEIVNEYTSVLKRRKHNQTVINALENAAYAIYEKWFIDYDFPVTEEYAEKIPNQGTIGEPYRASGGKMIGSALKTEIPYGWEVKTVGDMVLYNYSNYSQRIDNFNEILYLDTSSITNNKVDSLQKLSVSNDTIPSRAKRKVMDGDLVYSTVRPNLNHFGIIRKPEINTVVSTGFIVLQPNSKNLSSELLMLHLTTKKTTKSLRAKADMSTTTYPSIRNEDILELPLVVPIETGFEVFPEIFKTLFDIVDKKSRELSLLRSLEILLHQKLAAYGAETL